MKISLIGLGYVGLPLALQIAYKGYQITGIDNNKNRVINLNKNQLPFTDPYITKLFPQKRFKASTKLTSSDIYIVCVPTPVDEKNMPDLNILIQVIKTIASVLHNDQLVIIESTIYPGTCEEVIKPLLDVTKKRYFLAHCPERINPRDKEWNLSNTPRIIGGINKKSTDKAVKFYRSIIDADIYPVSFIKEAEATKILENTFRDVNIAFINEMAQSFYRMGIDIINVIKAASTKPYGFLPHYPGIGVGGHCIAVDPYYMIEKGRMSGFDHEFLKLARKINSNMPLYTVNLLQLTLNKLKLPLNGTTIGVYGLSYKPNIEDDRESPSYALVNKLKERLAKVITYDPYLPSKSTARSLPEFLQMSKFVIIATAHDEIININYDLFKKYKIRLIIDGRNCLDKDKIKKMEIIYRGIGRK